MDDDMFAIWVARPSEERMGIMRVNDPEIVRLIDFNMRMLWTAEIQARHFGVQGPVHPFDHVQLPLLSSMQFDGVVEGGEQVFREVKWPVEFGDDPMVLASALQCALQGNGAQRQAPRAIKPKKWSQLLQPPAKSWVDFERQLALVAEQLLLHAGGGSITTATSGTGACAPEAGSDGEDGRASGNASDDGADGTGSQKPSVARSAKRARQRERRRMGKALTKTRSDGCDENTPAMVGDIPIVSSGNIIPVVADSTVGRGRTSSGGLPLTKSRVASWNSASLDHNEVEQEEFSVAPKVNLRRSIEANVLNSLRATVERRSHDDGLGSGGAVGSTTGSRASPVEANADSADSYFASVGSVMGEAVRTDGSSNEEQADVDIYSLENFGAGVTAGGMGRGRPIGPLGGLPAQSRSGGRGKALAPPPGLQGLALGRGQKKPSGLSMPWIPGPAIPEDEDITDSPLVGPWAGSSLLLPSLELPGNALGDAMGYPGSDVSPTYADRTPSCWTSYAATPVASYSEAPDLQFSAGVNRGVIPMYVTVPLAMAHSCPHCGGHFALPPEAEGVPG